MADVGAALRDHLAADGTLTALIGVYGSPAVPAIFTDTVPEDRPALYIVVTLSSADPSYSTKNTSGRAVFRDVGCYDATQADDTTAVVAMAERVQELVDRVKVTVPGLTPFKGAWLNTVRNDGPEILGRVVMVELGFNG